MRAVRTGASGWGTLVGVGAGLTLVVLLVLQSATSTGAFGTKTTETETVTKTSTVTATEKVVDQISASFANHMLLYVSRNVTAIVSQYEGNATLTWTGSATNFARTYNGGAGLAGTYNGTGSITTLLESFFGKFSTGTGVNFIIANVTRTIAVTANDSALVNSSFGFAGVPTINGDIIGTVSAQDSYAYSATSGAWLISRETWNFTTLSFEYPIYT